MKKKEARLGFTCDNYIVMYEWVLRKTGISAD